LSTLAREAGFRGLFAGLGPRCLMTAGLVAGQFAIYGAVKDGGSPFVPCIGGVNANMFGGRDSYGCAGRIRDP
jgi:Mitochondrial carrier protein